MAVPQPKGNEGQGAGLIFQGRTEAQVLAATVRCPVTPAVDAAAPLPLLGRFAWPTEQT